MPPLPIGVLGAGTMGAGIARLALGAGARVLVHDPAGVEVEGAQAVELAGLEPCGLVIEAVPEDLALKRELLAALEDVVAPDAVLATNTSSLLVTACAAGLRHPERVVGMHFFNPPEKMRLVEIVAGEASSPEALAVARAAGAAMGKHVIDAADGPGFLVNRCNRPFSLEALRIVEEGIATVEQVDRIARLGGGFRMGPFELMDLVGLDTGFAVQRSFYEQSFGEPRWRPSPLMARMVAAGRLGRKTGRGWYDHPRPPATEVTVTSVAADGLVAGDNLVAADVAEAAAEAGWDVADPSEAAGEVPFLIVDCGHDGEEPLQGGPQVLLVDSAPLSALDPGGPSAGFYALPGAGLVELTRGSGTAPETAAAAEAFFGSLGRAVEWVGDAPGLVLGRLLAQLANEACFALGAGVGSAQDIDTGAVYGLNHPVGPLQRADEVGAEELLALLLALHAEYGEERYRPAPVLVRTVREGGRFTHT